VAANKITAYVLIVVKGGCEYSVLEEVRKMKEVKESYITYGGWDIIAKIETDNISRLGYIVTKIRQFPGVERTETLICM